MKSYLGGLLAAVILFSAGSAWAGEKTIRLAVEKMTCVACPFIVKKSLSAVEGVKAVTVSYEAKTATVTFDDSKATLKNLTDAILERGYPSKEIKQDG